MSNNSNAGTGKSRRASARQPDEPSPTDEINPVLPDQLKWLVEALKPAGDELHQPAEFPTADGASEFETLTGLARHMGLIDWVLRDIDEWVNDIMSTVIAREDASPLEVGRAAGQLQQLMHMLATGYRDALSTMPNPGAHEARTLLLGVYRHHMTYLAAWLDHLSRAIADPVAEMRRQGLKPARTVTLTISLNLASPPQMARLLEIVEEMRDAEPTGAASEPTAQERRPGALATLGALLFGLGLAQTSSRHRD